MTARPRHRRRLLAAFAAAVVALATLTAVPADAGGPTEPARVVAKIRWGSDPGAVAAELDAVVVDTLVGARRIVLLETDDKDAKKAVKRLEDDPRIIWVEPHIEGGVPEGDRFHAWPSETAPRDATWREMMTQPLLAELDLAAAHSRSTGAGVVVAVLDTGVAADHPDLDGRVKRRLDVIDGDFDPDDVGNGIDDDGDGHVDEAVGHGTHVAGAVLLVAPDAQILAYRVLDSDGGGSVFGVAEAIRHAVDDGADVVNLSFGTPKKFESRVLDEALAHARANGVVVVAAAGNDGSGKKRYPAAESEILAVGAYDTGADRLADFASHGKWVRVAAPGVDITSTTPSGYGTWSGSSMAAPLVSGQVALLLAADPTLEPKDVDKVIRETAVKIDGGPKVEKGHIDIVAALDEVP